MKESKNGALRQAELLRQLTDNAFMCNPAASANECTGITPHVPSDADEARAYTEIYDVPVSSADSAAQYKRLIRAKKRFLNKR